MGIHHKYDHFKFYRYELNEKIGLMFKNTHYEDLTQFTLLDIKHKRIHTLHSS